jgi:protein arginine kinase
MDGTSPFQASDQWLDRPGPRSHVVVSSRVRYARNLPSVPFPMRARPEELQEVAQRVESALQQVSQFQDGMRFDLGSIRSIERNYLKENHLISAEMDKGRRENRMMWLARDLRVAVMVNEEDHLRLYALETGFQPQATLGAAVALEAKLGHVLPFAFSSKYGFLTACPTNTGTGLRASMMLHLPGLGLTKKLPDLFKSLPQYGLTVRGFYGENSENTGDFFQVSNEVTLGISEEGIVDRLTKIVEEIIKREELARKYLFEQNRTFIDDEVWRAYGLLAHARVISSQEAVQLLSKLRFGIDHGYFPPLTHERLNKLVIEIQPGHLQYLRGSTASAEARDVLRAELLRQRLERNAAHN